MDGKTGLQPIGGSLPALKGSEGRPLSPMDKANQAPAMTNEEKDHQQWIMLRVETFLEPFFQANDDMLMDARLIEWASVLQPLPAKAIDIAMVEYHRQGPRSAKGKLIKPAAGDIYARARELYMPKDVARYDAATRFAELYKSGQGVPAFYFRDDRLMAEVLERGLLPVEELKRHGAFIPSRFLPDATTEEKDT